MSHAAPPAAHGDRLLAAALLAQTPLLLAVEDMRSGLLLGAGVLAVLLILQGVLGLAGRALRDHWLVAALWSAAAVAAAGWSLAAFAPLPPAAAPLFVLVVANAAWWRQWRSAETASLRLSLALALAPVAAGLLRSAAAMRIGTTVLDGLAGALQSPAVLLIAAAAALALWRHLSTAPPTRPGQETPS